MNLHILQGIIAFVAWSVFSSWYYLNHIKEFDSVEKKSQVVQAPKPIDDSPIVVEKNDTITLENDSPIEVALIHTVFFTLNSTDLVSKNSLDIILDTLSNLSQMNDLEIRIVGHTCDLGSEAYNEKLSMLRAEAVENKILPLKPTSSKIFALGRGESQPAFPNTSEINRAKNRRVSITITNNP